MLCPWFWSFDLTPLFRKFPNPHGAGESVPCFPSDDTRSAGTNFYHIEPYFFFFFPEYFPFLVNVRETD